MTITNPLLRSAYDADWYFPPDLPTDITSHALYEKAVGEGWHEWIETELDWEAVRRKFVYDQSYDVDGKPAYWLDGGWLSHDGSNISMDDEQDAIGYVGRGDHVMRFCETFLRFTKEPLTGQPYRFLPWMRKVVAALYGWVDASTNARLRRFQYAYMTMGKKNAKALSNETLVPTPDGWKKHGELKVGDKLFDSKGKVVEVIYIHPKCDIDYEVEFTNGEIVKCSGEHSWVTETLLRHENSYSSASEKSTLEISTTLKTSQSLNHRVRLHEGSYIHIKDVRSIDPVRGNCITVSGDGTYLCGKTMVPTHNSATLSALSNYMLCADGTPKAQCYICACDRNQARIIYDEAAHMAKESDLLSSIVEVVDSRARLVHPSSGSFLQVLSADAHRNDGVDSSFTAIDEIHRHPNRKLYAVMERAGQARPEPLLAVITTYGPSTTDGSIWAEIHNEAKAQMAGDRPRSYRNFVMIASAEPTLVTVSRQVETGATRIPVRRLEQPIDVELLKFDLSHFEEGAVCEVQMAAPAKRFQTYLEVEPVSRDIPAFSEAEANKEWKTLHGVKRANPSADIIFPADRVLEKAEESRTPEKEAETKQLNFNIVSGSGRRWIPSAVWQSCGEMEVQPKWLIGRSAVAGLDFSFGGDLVGFGLAVPKWDMATPYMDIEKPRIDLLTWAWMPDDDIVDREEKEQFPYRHLAQQPYLLENKGCIRFCPGQTVNFSQIAEEVIEILSLFNVVAVAHDPNYAQFAIPKIESAGFNCIAHRQGAVSMSPPCKRFADMLYARQLAHGNNPLLDRAIEGAVLHTPDKAGNTYLSKGNSKNRIDVLVAHVMAVGWCCSPPTQQSGAYAGPGSGMWD